MAIYFKCPKCGAYIEDLFGEHAADKYEDVGNYVCNKCDATLQQIDHEEYMKNQYL